ncbi:zinc finger HIT domain-containing protein 2 isoform X2 [Amblyraja radiata]|uniref:zinc finger HIT domain-containing protein 2 isoform X2 n=1 Tax=Amblyraja radiata TaxID=386614 RepID=UPI001403A40B|nr:zinc finger HIT domain-containing protein 2 isoform X2 [Amblyraja radiata]
MAMAARPAGEAEACGLCTAAAARYTCPRCNRPYCSLACYRGGPHRACAELFYRDAVLAELRPGAEAGRRDLCSGMRSLQEAEAQRPEPEGLSLEPDAPAPRLWAALSPGQRADFERRVSGGEAAAWIPPWRPWWRRQRQRRPVVEEVDASEEMREEQRVAGDGESSGEEDADKETAPASVWDTDDSVPAVCTNIAPLATLTACPSPLVAFSLVNVLYAYAFSLRLVNGDVQGAMRGEFIEVVLAISKALDGSHVYTSTGEALQAAVESIRSSPHVSTPLLLARAMEDVSALLAGGDEALGSHYTLAAISHLDCILAKGRQCRGGEGKTGRAARYRAGKKCAFLLSWAREHQHVLATLSAEARLEFTASLQQLLQVEKDTSTLEKAWGAKRPPAQRVLIEELNP